MNKKLYEVQIWKLLLFLEFMVVMIAAFSVSKSLGFNGVALPGVIGENDSFYYYNQVVSNVSGINFVNKTGTAFVPMISFMAKFFGSTNILFLKSLNFIGFILLVNIIIKICFMFESRNSAEPSISSRVLVRMILFPSLVLAVCVPFGRDIWIYVFFMYSVYFGALVVKSDRLYSSLIEFSASLFLLFLFRKYAALSVIFGLLLYFFFFRFNRKTIFIFITLAIFLFVLWYTFFMDVKIPLVNLSLGDALNYQAGNTTNNLGIVVLQRTGGSDFMSEFNSSNVFVFGGQLMLSFLGNLIGPFIWQAKSIPMILVFVTESIPMILLVFKIFKMRQIFYSFLKGNRSALFIFFELISWWSVIAVTNKNIGTGMRLKIPLFILLWIIYYSCDNFARRNSKCG